MSKLTTYMGQKERQAATAQNQIIPLRQERLWLLFLTAVIVEFAK